MSGHAASSEAAPAHRDDLGARLGMWLFLATEMVLFGGLFISYSYMRYRYPADFHHGGAELSVPLGVANTLILLTSSLTVVLSLVAIQHGNRSRSLALLASTMVLGSAFLVIKAVEWSAKFEHGLYPSSAHMATRPLGEQVFFGLYFTMTGLHGLHVLAGLVVFVWLMVLVAQGHVNADRYVKLENGGLFWHLVDVIWIFLLPLFYLAA